MTAHQLHGLVAVWPPAASPPTVRSVARNYLLDGMRGVAAFLVLIYHAGDFTRAGWAPSGYLAVDFFFALSGLVIVATYEDRLRAGLSLGAFTRARFARLYPAFAVALPLGMALALVKWHVGLLHASAGALASTLILNAAMLPSALPHDELFVVNAPAWSLFMEIAINLFYAAIGFRLSSARVAGALVVLAAAVAAGIYATGAVNFGATWAGAGFGFARAALSFGVGGLVARWRAGAAPRATPFALVPLALLVAVLFIPEGPLRPMIDLAFVFVGVPLAIVVCSGIDVPPGLRRACASAGALSYPLYITHFGILRVFFLAGQRLQLGAVPSLIAGVAAALLVAAAVSRWVEPFGRRLLAGARGPQPHPAFAGSGSRPISRSYSLNA